MKAFAVFLSGIILFFLAAFGAEAAAPDAKRVALVIGNSKYINAVALPNPANDAHLIASTLHNAGFGVIEGVDQDNAGMHSLISRFTEQAYDADLAVIFYAGHGMQVDGKNYLIPIDADLTSPAYLPRQSAGKDAGGLAAEKPLHLTRRRPGAGRSKIGRRRYGRPADCLCYGSGRHRLRRRGPQTRQAIGIWQAKSGLPQTTYLTREQLAFLVIQTDPMMEAVRARYAADQARAAQPKQQVVQKVRSLGPVALKPGKQRQIAHKWRDREIIVQQDDRPPPRDDNSFLAKALIFGAGVAVGSVLKQ
ncbi:caspase family protein [Mesorhizobium australicum]|uniref:Caspase family protein n=2 Tax=Mesorhizobium australicum TaxID=536018 RepID=A0ACC6T4Z2_9HYPH